MKDGTATIRGTVQNIVYYAEDTGYTVAEIAAEAVFTAVGTMPKLHAGDAVTLHGSWVTHEVYGEQWRVTGVEIHAPEGVEAIKRFLASGVVKGIGPALAARLTDRFGEKTLQVLRREPRLAATVKGISRQLAARVSEQMAAQEAEQELALLLMPAGISYNRVRRIYGALGIGALDSVREDPWVIMRLVSGIGFETANKVAAALGFAADHPARIRSAFWQLLYDELMRGHTYAQRDYLLKQLAVRLELEPAAVANALADGADGILVDTLDGKAVCSFNQVYAMEQEAARLIQAALARVRAGQPVSVTAAHDYAASLQMPLSDEQAAAVTMGLNERLAVITGGPGTGKTTIVKALVGLAGQQGRRVALAAPTGRAARRLSEASGQPAVTLHRLLNLQPDDQLPTDRPSAGSPIKADLLIVDESSMLDLPLFWRLISALSPATSLILVGDADQLPSVGPGQVLRDLLATERIKRTELTKIYRQAEDNLIAINAHRLNHGQPLAYPQKIDSPFLAIFPASDDEMVLTLERLIQGPLREHYGITDMRDVQVLAPLRRGAAGVTNLNRRLQMLHQGGGCDGVSFGSTTFCRGDKVIQTRNNYDLLWQNVAGGEAGSGVMNGETGIITDIDAANSALTVLFENEHLAMLGQDDLLDLELAYAITIHKSQGSEYDTVCLMLPHAPPDFLTKNLVYTAFTRARHKLILIGKKNALAWVQKAGRVTTRRTRLAAFLAQP